MIQAAYEQLEASAPHENITINNNTNIEKSTTNTNTTTTNTTTETSSNSFFASAFRRYKEERHTSTQYQGSYYGGDDADIAEVNGKAKVSGKGVSGVGVGVGGYEYSTKEEREKKNGKSSFQQQNRRRSGVVGSGNGKDSSSGGNKAKSVTGKTAIMYTVTSYNMTPNLMFNTVIIYC